MEGYIGITVSDNIRNAYNGAQDVLDSHLERVGGALRMFQQNLLGRDIDAKGFNIHIHMLDGKEL